MAYDKYENPDYGKMEIYEKNPLEKAGETAGPIVEKIKENKTAIIAILAVLLIGFFAYDFFVGSVKTVTFNVVDTEGKMIAGAGIKISDQSGVEVARARTNESAQLKTGTYSISIVASGYKSISGQSLEVTGNLDERIKMQADKNLELTGSLPSSFFTGETKEMEVTIQNKGDEPVEAKLLLEGDAKENLEMQSQEMILPPGTNTRRLNIAAKTGISQKNLDKELEGEIRIEGLDTSSAKITGKFTISKLAERDYSVKIGSSETKTSFDSLSPGETDDQEIKVTNDSDTPIENVTVEVEISESFFTDKEEAKNWFSFIPSNTISQVLSKQTGAIKISVTIPSTISFPQDRTEEILKGIVKVTSPAFTKTFSLELKIEKPKTGLQIAGIKETITIKKEGNAYPETNGFLDVRNTGEVLLRDAEARVSCDSQGVSWMSLEGNQPSTLIGDIATKETKNVSYKIKIPNSVKAGTSVRCDIGIYYIEPSGAKIDPPVAKKILILTQ